MGGGDGWHGLTLVCANPGAMNEAASQKVKRDAFEVGFHV
jgi:hypothetical protein